MTNSDADPTGDPYYEDEGFYAHAFYKGMNKVSWGQERIENAFGYHKGTPGEDGTIRQHAEVRNIFRQAAILLDEVLPEGRAKSVTLTELETASMWANKAVAEQSPLVPEEDGA